MQVLATAMLLELLNMGGEVAGELVAAGVGPTQLACTGVLTMFITLATCTTLRRHTPRITILMRFLDLGPVPRINASILSTEDM